MAGPVDKRSGGDAHRIVVCGVWAAAWVAFLVWADATDWDSDQWPPIVTITLVLVVPQGLLGFLVDRWWVCIAPAVLILGLLLVTGSFECEGDGCQGAYIALFGILPVLLGLVFGGWLLRALVDRFGRQRPNR